MNRRRVHCPAFVLLLCVKHLPFLHQKGCSAVMIEKVSTAAVKGAEMFVLWQELSNKGSHPAESSCFHLMKTGLVVLLSLSSPNEIAWLVCKCKAKRLSYCSSIAEPLSLPQLFLSVMKSIRSSHDVKA